MCKCTSVFHITRTRETAAHKTLVLPERSTLTTAGVGGANSSQRVVPVFRKLRRMVESVNVRHHVGTFAVEFSRFTLCLFELIKSDFSAA